MMPEAVPAAASDNDSKSRRRWTIRFRRKAETPIDWKRLFFTVLGISLFFAVYLSPPWPAAIDPMGEAFELSHQGKAALGLFLLAAVWWVFEVIPIGVTSITIAVVQVLFLIRPDIMLVGGHAPVGGAELAFKEFMHPSVWFIFGSIVIGMVFTKTGLTKRLAYKMLVLVGEKTSRIYLGCFIMTAALTLVMAHTAVAATVFPLLVAIYRLYDEGDEPTNFGKGLFIGMAYVAGAGSIITLLGAARGAVALGFYKEITGQDITFFGLTWFMFPVGWVMVFVLWAFFMVYYKPERASIPGATVLFFVLKILDIGDLENVPWNIILLFGGAMSLGYCLVLTGAADWLAINTVSMLKTAPAMVFILGMTFFVMIMTNLIMNVAAIAICLPVALKVAPYLGVGGEVILFSALVVAGMPFLLLVGAAPNAIAYESKQFTSGEFFKAGIPASLLLMVVVAIFVIFIWPLMGMEVIIPTP
jgi:sodium-dependent dicarboxylate transporter 2/3/5